MDMQCCTNLFLPERYFLGGYFLDFKDCSPNGLVKKRTTFVKALYSSFCVGKLRLVNVDR